MSTTQATITIDIREGRRAEIRWNDDGTMQITAEHPNGGHTTDVPADSEPGHVMKEALMKLTIGLHLARAAHRKPEGN